MALASVFFNYYYYYLLCWPLVLTFISFSREIIKEFAEFLGQDRSPLCNTKMNPILPQNIQRHLTHFSLITHGFGSHAIVSALSAAQNYINESIKYLDKQLSNYQQAAVSGADVSLVIDAKKEDGKQWRSEKSDTLPPWSSFPCCTSNPSCSRISYKACFIRIPLAS